MSAFVASHGMTCKSRGKLRGKSHTKRRFVGYGIEAKYVFDTGLIRVRLFRRADVREHLLRVLESLARMHVSKIRNSTQRDPQRNEWQPHTHLLLQVHHVGSETEARRQKAESLDLNRVKIGLK
jgi:hypothetical protein